MHASLAGRARGLSDRSIAWLFITPSILLLLALNIFPLIWTIRLSFTNFRSNAQYLPTRGIGLENYRDILTDHKANATISGSLFASAKGGNVTAQIFWLKTRAHWRERLTAGNPIPNADAEPNSEVVLVLPDNSRDPELTQVLQDAQRKYFVRKRQR